MSDFDPDEIDSISQFSGQRATLAGELSDPRVAHGLYQLTQNEVPASDPSGQQAFIESVFNRASRRGMTLAQTINDRTYFPESSFRWREPTQDSSQNFNSILKRVLSGSNLSRGATGNESGGERSGGAPITFSSPSGERFVLENQDRRYVIRTPRIASISGRFDPDEGGVTPSKSVDFHPDQIPSLPTQVISPPYQEGDEVRRAIPLPMSQQPKQRLPVEVSQKELSTLEAPEGSPTSQDVDRAVAGDLTKPPGKFVPSYVAHLTQAINQALPRQPLEYISPMRPQSQNTVADAFREGGIMGVVSHVADAPSNLSTDQSRAVIKAAIQIASPQLVNQIRTLKKFKPELVDGIEQGAAEQLSGFTKPSTMATLPAFAIPGVAEAWGINELSKTPEEWSRIKEIIDKNGVGSKEAVTAITNEVARLGMASTAATGRSIGAMRTESALRNAWVPPQVRDAMQSFWEEQKPPPIEKVAEAHLQVQSLIDKGVPEDQAIRQVTDKLPSERLYTSPDQFHPDEPTVRPRPQTTAPEIAPLPDSAFAPVGFSADMDILGSRQLTDSLWRLGQKLNTYRKGAVAMIRMRPERDMIAAGYDRIDNHASMVGNHFKNETRLLVGDNPLDRQAMVPVIQSGGNFEELVRQNNLVQNSDKAAPELKRAYAYAVQHFSSLNTLAPKIRALYDRMYQSEQAHGINYKEIENYVPQKYDFDVMNPDSPVVLDSTGGKGSGTSFFKRQRTFRNYAEAIAQGYIPKSFDIADLTGNRGSAGQRLINQRLWVNAMRNELDPITQKPIVVTLEQGKTARGYVPRELFPGVRVGVSEFFDPIVSALTAESHFPMLPLKMEAGVKHGMLAFDTFHASRLMQMQLALQGKIGWHKGLALLEYPDHMLDEAVKNNEITTRVADWVRNNRSDFEGLVNSGLNIGRISDALYKDVTKDWPVVGKYQRWLFDKLNRGIISESSLYMLDRNRAAHPEWSQKELFRRSAKEANIYYRNLRSQGIFKRKTWQDAARFFTLAPQWWEGGITSELMGYGQALKAPIDLATKKRLYLGNVAKGMGTGIMAYSVASQLINMFTRGHPTWENPEPGQKWSAWIPDVTGKTNGFFLNPLTVFAENTHDFMKYMERDSSALEAGKQIVQNKFSPMSNAIRDVVWGKDYFGQPLDTLWDRVEQTAFDLSPLPVSVKSAREGMPTQRTALASLGVRLDVAQASNIRVRSLANQYRSSHGDHLVRTTPVPSPYRALDRALESGDMKLARKEYDKLLSKGYKKDKIEKRYDHLPSHPFTKVTMEDSFYHSLSPDERKVYHDARLHQHQLRQRFYQIQRITGG